MRADAGELPRLLDVAGNHARVFRLRRHERQHAAPELGRFRVVLPLIGGGTGERQRLQVVRFDLERALHEALGLAREFLASRHGERVGEVRQELRIARRLLRGLGVRGDRLGEATEHHVGTAEELPAIGVVRVLAQLGGESRDHRVDLLRRYFRLVRR